MIPLLPLSLFRDWYIFYTAAEAITNHISPYNVEGFFNPIQVAWLLSLTTWIPFTIWVPIMIGASFLLIILLARRRSHWILLSLPFIFGMSMGSLDVFLWVPARLLGGWGLSLLTLKPQLGVLWIPLQLLAWGREKNWRQIIYFGIACLILWGVPTLIQPGWITTWLAALPPVSSRMSWAASIAGLSALTGVNWVYIVLFLIVLVILMVWKSRSFYVAAMFSPSIWPSDWMICAEFASWKFTLLSWALVPTGLSPNGAQFFWLLGLLTWLEQHPEHIHKIRERIKRSRSFSKPGAG
jgi:hypothetical protein